MLTLLSAVITAAANLLTAVFITLCMLLALRFILNFYADGTSNPGIVFVFRVTEVVLDPVRRKMGIEPRTVDLSLIVVFFGAIFFGTLMIDLLRKIAVHLAG
ncbi:MAG: hypothetical protein A3G34_09005 [Candidatus Lindowbacteria bacterium RIFCSPLOWO2_12_FULL_62_27]|nr:MAG: hypothetical protein A3G34_09005 [Candidatus Lindowbacteria bacterium RIFCSPLOWO2_12_FULL_62_27]